MNILNTHVSETFIIIAITLCAIIPLLYLLIKNKKSDYNSIIKYYLNRESSQINYYYLNASNLKEEFSEKASFIFNTNIPLQTLKDLEKIIGNKQYEKIQEIISLKMKIIAKQTSEFKNDSNFYRYFNNNKNNSEKIIVSFLDNDNKTKYIECIIESFTNHNHYPLGIVIWFFDSTEVTSEMNKLESDLSKYIESHSQLLEVSNKSIEIYSADNKLKYFNNAFVLLWDLDKEWLLKHPTYSEILEILRQKRKLPEEANFISFKKKRTQLFHDLYSNYTEFMHLPNGRSLKITITPHAFGGVMISSEDMTTRLELERSFKNSSNVQKSILDHLNEAVAIYGQDGKLKSYNHKFLKFAKLTKEEADKFPSLAEILELNKGNFIIENEDDWLNIKNNIIALLYEREFHSSVIKLKNGSKILRTISPLPDGATLVSYIDNNYINYCKAIIEPETTPEINLLRNQSEFFNQFRQQSSKLISEDDMKIISQQSRNNIESLNLFIDKQTETLNNFFHNLKQ